jgi:hypothetical protein
MSDSEIVLNPGAGGDSVAADLVASRKHQRVKLSIGPTGTAADASTANPVPVAEGMTYAYAAGTTAGTVDVPSAALLRRVSVIAGGSAATVTIGGGATITIPAGGVFDEQIPGRAVGTDVVIGGSVVSYYVSWVA